MTPTSWTTGRRRRALGLPLDRPLALVALGAGNINDTSHETGAVVAALRRLGVEICVTQTEIADRTRLGPTYMSSGNSRSPPVPRVRLAISASGYNSFHELLRFGIPTLFIPNQNTALDDQHGRAQFAADRGLAHMIERVSVDTATPLLCDLLDRGQAMVAKVPRSIAAMELPPRPCICASSQRQRPVVPEDPLLDRLARRMPISLGASSCRPADPAECRCASAGLPPVCSGFRGPQRQSRRRSS